MEDGEIIDRALQNGDRLRPGDAYDPAYEWPGEPSSITLEATEAELCSTRALKKCKKKEPSLRLVVHRTSILPSKHRLAILDGYTELQLGRDVPLTGTNTPKVRLKEMEVSKLHATVFWDAQRLEWSVVDMGSMHGTFLKSGPSTSSDDPGLRLSPPRVASVPKRLRHLDHLTLGSTTFVVHIHDDHVPCAVCSPAGGDEIPLFHTRKKAETSSTRFPTEAVGLEISSHIQQVDRDPKKALAALKHNLLFRHQQQGKQRSLSPSNGQYVDRSARRRALHPSAHSDSPGVNSALLIKAPYTSRSSPDIVLELPRRSPEPSSQAPTPLPSSNVGHRLLMKQGWMPGTALGTSDLTSDDGRVGLVEPLEVNFSINRSGVGHAETKNGESTVSRKDQELYDRWNSLGHDK
ncbi:hypothetical protein M378DRAFT_163258 [Amanita muscaria Koide BX008]|uniref:Angiogenic factor with G patch and FHA domains 1 n=1 Tax=Amanita muscaria (strain Koide BX008) TaxID=946122 RepID=A0A0C2TCD3_AMAMK|nr:hypothetical protein M378DRAFT_163258 [Amanita muscaria Koide BX008]